MVRNNVNSILLPEIMFSFCKHLVHLGCTERDTTFTYTNSPSKQEKVIKRGKYLRVILFQGRETNQVGDEELCSSIRLPPVTN